ncbi:RNA polymerase sigma-70 factor [Nakamurella aerolata]|uniref:RNA polymerase sigma-70 factor n=1 Tax=Nakamurella aerolata TaxID=1656892 RepID=A0A849AE14_9ACTN|nr:RNA polymerase sigma-70 factor [Nakamurella aerolata]NNG37428.1 RNA polymerase sigma-70 factor [Nakamurella aerolata]
MNRRNSFGSSPDERAGDPPGAGTGTDVFVTHRSLLFTVAYELLGSAADAEDVVQETWLRWSAAARDEVREPRAYLVRIVTRQALNRLRTLARRREDYVGDWLPEPLLTSPDLADDVELAESVSLAMLTVLETLTPTERAVFVLHEVFGESYDDIAAAIDKQPAAVRQLAHRAREHVAARRPRQRVSAAQQRAVMQSFVQAVNSGDLAGLVDALAPDVVLTTDGGGLKKSALRPIVGVDKVLRFLLAVTPTGPAIRASTLTVNGEPALRIDIDGAVDSIVTAEIVDGAVTGLYAVRNPEKLTALADEVPLSR